VRTNTASKVSQLSETVMEKLQTADKQDFSRFGLYWYNETGPLWLSENASIRAYGFKNGVSGAVILFFSLSFFFFFLLFITGFLKFWFFSIFIIWSIKYNKINRKQSNKNL
jgi:hypothetical protein